MVEIAVMCDVDNAGRSDRQNKKPPRICCEAALRQAQDDTGVLGAGGSVALFVFFAAAAWAEIVASDFVRVTDRLRRFPVAKVRVHLLRTTARARHRPEQLFRFAG